MPLLFLQKSFNLLALSLGSSLSLSVAPLPKPTFLSFSLPFGSSLSISVPFGSSLGDSSLPFDSVVRRSHSISPSVVRRSHSVPLSLPFDSSLGGSSLWFLGSALFGGSSPLPVPSFVSLGGSFLSISPLVLRWFLSLNLSVVLDSSILGCEMTSKRKRLITSPNDDDEKNLKSRIVIYFQRRSLGSMYVAPELPYVKGWNKSNIQMRLVEERRNPKGLLYLKRKEGPSMDVNLDSLKHEVTRHIMKEIYLPVLKPMDDPLMAVNFNVYLGRKSASSSFKKEKGEEEEGKEEDEEEDDSHGLHDEHEIPEEERSKDKRFVDESTTSGEVTVPDYHIPLTEDEKLVCELLCGWVMYSDNARNSVTLKKAMDKK
ncbi:hypothetical protein RIF29_21124 [Crotalaria pallida]|uniref:Uncharacterized protein n=1 Tax=Crotalaria pallida TaxID=3830 RepID=A0AAN9F622_CROPI